MVLFFGFRRINLIITGIIYEPWHYRYVGVDAAKEMTEKGLTLEEYVFCKLSKNRSDRQIREKYK